MVAPVCMIVPCAGGANENVSSSPSTSAACAVIEIGVSSGVDSC